EFLGHVNLFHGRVHQGHAWIGDLEVDAPEYSEAEDLSAIAYVRPHDIEVDRTLNGEPALAAHIVHILAIGPVVRLELAGKDNQSTNSIYAEISKERFRELQLARGDQVFIKPRKLDLFPNHAHNGSIH
ncbi:sulfate ABC transporter ATP-binding protein, partial [Betaproteobacteria bacterium PRO5]|nr:sulfate ABC transporter ATP-binding protein [Betaproteobacteria bacterium PRO5]